MVFATTVSAEQVTLAWDPNPEPDLAGYYIYYGERGTTPLRVDAGLNTNVTIQNLVAGRTYDFYATAFNTANIESDPSQTITYTVPTPPPTGFNVTSDTTTQGDWRFSYGAEGFSILTHAYKKPQYGDLHAYGATALVWENPASDPSALQKIEGTERVAAAFYGSTMVLDFDWSGPSPEQVAIYFVDYDGAGRSQKVAFYDAVTSELLFTTTLSSFVDGAYLVFYLDRDINVYITSQAGPNAVVSGVFYGGPAGSYSPGLAVTADTTTGGDWRSAYGASGYSILTHAAKRPANGNLRAYGATARVWEDPSSDPRALNKANSSQRIAASFYSSGSMMLDLDWSGSTGEQAAIYFLDYDGAGRVQEVDFYDAATGALLNTTTLSSFENGTYLAFTLDRDINVYVTRVSGPDAVVSGVFFGGSAGSYTPPLAVTTDTTTAGNWSSSYGASGYAILTHAGMVPSGGDLHAYGAAARVWANPDSNPASLHKVNSTERLAASFYSQSMVFDFDWNGSSAEQAAMYFMDWDAAGRVQKVDFYDATTGSLLTSMTLSGFQNGVYLVFSLDRDINVYITSIAGPDAVISGVFYGGPRQTSTLSSQAFAANTSPSPSVAAIDSETQGNWISKYGSQGAVIVGEGADWPDTLGYTPYNHQEHIWASDSDSPAALEKLSGSGRIAAAWYSEEEFEIEIETGNDQPSVLTAYFLDWDEAAREQTVELYNAEDGSFLGSHLLTEFQDGVYLSWEVQGQVILRIINENPGSNAVLSGFFLD